MRSEQSVCKSIKSMRMYAKNNIRGKPITRRIGYEEKHVMSVRTQVNINIKTGSINVVDGIYYAGKTVHMDSYKKQNCHDEALVLRMTESGRKSNKSRRKAELDKYFPLKEFNEVIT